MITKNASKVLHKVAEDTTVYGFAPGTISHNPPRTTDPETVADHDVFTYKPTVKNDNSIKGKATKLGRKILGTPDKEYTYTKSNMPFYANAVKHRNELNNMLDSDIIDTDAVANWLTDDPNYATMRRKHYAGVSDKDWNKVFKPMSPKQRANMDNIKAPTMRGSDLASNYGGVAYFDPPWAKGSIHTSRGTMSRLKNGAPVEQNATHWSGSMLYPYTLDLPVAYQHEGIHAEQNGRDILNAPWTNKKRAQLLNTHGVQPLVGVDPYAIQTLETRQATASANRGVYALSRMLNKSDLNDKKWAQFDKNKLMYVRDNFKELPKSREEFIQRMQWLDNNPEIALLLGEGARGVSYRKELEMMNKGHRRNTDQLNSEWVQDAAAPGEAQKELDAFDDGWFLTNKNNNIMNKPRMSTYGLSPVVPA